MLTLRIFTLIYNNLYTIHVLLYVCFTGYPLLASRYIFVRGWTLPRARIYGLLQWQMKVLGLPERFRYLRPTAYGPNRQNFQLPDISVMCKPTHCLLKIDCPFNRHFRARNKDSSVYNAPVCPPPSACIQGHYRRYANVVLYFLLVSRQLFAND